MHSDGNNNHRAIIEGTISGVVVLVIIVVAIYSKDRKKRGLPLIPPILTSCWRQRIPQPSPLTFDLQQPSYPQQVLQFNSQSSREHYRDILTMAGDHISVLKSIPVVCKQCQHQFDQTHHHTQFPTVHYSTPPPDPG